jgi:methionyl-tRNA synthetase
MKNKFYITTPIYYVNAQPHIGHVYTTVKADVVARWKRKQGKEVFFSTGTDEHGLKIQKEAERAGKEPQIFVDEISSQFTDLWKRLDISYDAFIRTSGQEHKKIVIKTLEELYKKGAIYKGIYRGLYCVGCEQFLLKSQLVNGKCPDHNMEPEILEEENYLLKMSVLQKTLSKKIKSDELKITPETRKNEILSFLTKQKLEDISISRPIKKVSWGILLPFDQNHTTYVWIDALLNYLTVAPDFFPPDIQFMGKDIFRVHATIWPAILIHLNMPLPKEIYVHGFILSAGRKMSKTLGNVIDPSVLLGQYGKDALRHYLIKETTSFEDGDITEDKFREVYNADLANGIGNLFERVFTMAIDYVGHPMSHKFCATSDVTTTEDKYKFYMENYNLCDALKEVFAFAKKLDKYIDDKKPWVMRKNNDTELEAVLASLFFGIEKIIDWLEPFMPAKMLDAKNYVQKIKSGKIKKEEKLNLFPRIV